MDNDLGAMLENFLQDPAQMERLRGVIAGLNGGAEDASGVPAEAAVPPSDAPAAQETSALSGVPDSAQGVADLLRDPALMASLPRLLSMLQPSGGMSGTGGGRPSGGGDRNRHRTALLMALRPYLSDARREMIDSLVNLGRLGDLLLAGGEGKEKR